MQFSAEPAVKWVQVSKKKDAKKALIISVIPLGSNRWCFGNKPWQLTLKDRNIVAMCRVRR